MQGMNDVCEGCIETIDFQNERGVIEVATPNERVPLPSKIEFPLAELRVAAEDWSYVEEKTKVGWMRHRVQVARGFIRGIWMRWKMIPNRECVEKC